jgi:hypothetical protein
VIHALECSPAQALIVNDASMEQALGPSLLMSRLPCNTPVVTCCVPGNDETAGELGVDDCLAKPVNRTALLSALTTRRGSGIIIRELGLTASARTIHLPGGTLSAGGFDGGRWRALQRRGRARKECGDAGLRSLAW